MRELIRVFLLPEALVGCHIELDILHVVLACLKFRVGCDPAYRVFVRISSGRMIFSMKIVLHYPSINRKLSPKSSFVLDIMKQFNLLAE